MLTLKIKCKGRTHNDLELALDEARRRILQGNLCGWDSNDEGDFRFDISGEEEEPILGAQNEEG